MTKTENATDNYNMKKIFNSNQAPQPIGAYNQSVFINNMLYTSGQIAINPKTNKTEFGDISHETRLVMQHLEAILAEAELRFEHVIKVSIFVKDISNFAEVNKVYSEYFNQATAPAREMVEVADLPRHANVEISLIAAKY